MTWTLKRRQFVVVDNDWAGDPDGLVALAHHALSPADELVAVTGSFTSPLFGDPTGSAAHGARLADELLGMLGQAVPAVGGADAPFTGDVRDSFAARAIVEAARTREIVLVCGGPLTNVADALRSDPSIARTMRLLWVGGASAGADGEYNWVTDAAAAEFVLAHDDLRIDRFPRELYSQLAVSVAELECGLRDGGEVGRWLWQRYVELPLPAEVDVDPVWPLGDSAPLAVTALPHAAVRFAPAEGAHRVCEALDPRLIVGDLFARLRLHG